MSRQSRLRRTLPWVLVALLLALGYESATFAATGDSLVLGRINQAGAATTVQRTTPGPALVLKSTPKSAPLKVTSNVRVARLNADRVDGLEGSALQHRPWVLTNAETRQNLSLGWSVQVPAGTYQVDLTASVLTVGEQGYTPICTFQSAPSAPLPLLYPLGQAGTRFDFQAMEVLTVAPGGSLKLSCTASNTETSLSVTPGNVSIVATRIDAVRAKNLTVQ